MVCKPSIHKGRRRAKFSVYSVPRKLPDEAWGQKRVWRHGTQQEGLLWAWGYLCSLHLFPNWLLLYLSELRFPHLSDGIETTPKLTWAICLLEGKTLENRSQTLGEEMDGPPVGFWGFLAVLPAVFVPRFSRTTRACLEQCWRTGASPLSRPIRGGLPSSRSPEEGLAIQGDRTHPPLTPPVSFTASSLPQDTSVPAWQLGKRPPGWGRTPEGPAESRQDLAPEP